MTVCKQCPRRCGVNRDANERGFCGMSSAFRVARIALHPWEEPCISGANGSGTIFFSGCNLRCVFCQNHSISHLHQGTDLSAQELETAMLSLQEQGAHNINLVTPSHYALQLRPLLEHIKPALRIPIVYNCGGYEQAETLRALEGLVDIYLPDVKYYSSTLAQKYSDAPDYYPVAEAALAEMLRQQPQEQCGADGLLRCGVLVRHLVLPSCRKDSIALLSALAKRFGSDAFRLSLMSQYTPDFAADAPYPELHRRVTTFEYNSVLEHAKSLGFDGYFQGRSAADTSYTPDFGQPLQR